MESLVSAQRQNEPTTVIQRIKPWVHRTGCTGIDVDNVRGIERRFGAVAVYDLDARIGLEVFCRLLGKSWVELNGCGSSRGAHEVRQDRSVIAGPRADMEDMPPVLARQRRSTVRAKQAHHC